MKKSFLSKSKHTIFLFIVISIIGSTGCGSRSGHRDFHKEKNTVSHSKNNLADTDRGENDSLISGKVIKIIDGDTFDFLTPDYKTVRIRMDAIDAPERGMPFYRVSKQYLANLCFGKIVTCKIINTDFYKRKIGRAYLKDGTDLSLEMIKAGLAWHFRKYNSDKKLETLEKNAEANHVGLWQDKNPDAPWDVRKHRMAGISDKEYEKLKH